MYHYKLVIDGETICETDDIFEALYEFDIREHIGVTFYDCLIETEVA